MMHSVRIRALATAVCAGLFASLLFAADAGKFAVKKKTTLGGEGGWDYLTWDAAGQRLFIARATRVMVVDAASAKQIGEIANTEGVHGIALVAELGKGFTSNGRENTATVFDLKSLKEIMKVKTGNGPDAIVYDPASKRVFTMNGRGRDTTAIEAASNAVAGTVELGGKPEFAVADGKGTVFVNIEDKAELVALDTKKLAVKNRWKMGKCEEPTGLALDAKNRRLFAGCSNKEMAIMDADSGKVIAELPIGDYVDATAFDAKLGLAFSSNGDGTLTIVREENPNKFSVAQTVTTQRGARTMTLDAASHTIYTVTADFGPPQANGRPSVLPGTFVVMEIGK